MLQKCNLWNVASVFFDKPEKGYNLLNISRKIELAHTSVKSHLHTLQEYGIIEKTENEISKKPRYYYRARKETEIFRHHKKIYNMDLLMTSGFITHIARSCYPSSIVLFGSFSRGEDGSQSDIDLFIECNKTNLDLEEYEFRLNRKISLLFRKDFKNLPEELKNNIMNGIVLYGFLEGHDAGKDNTRSEQSRFTKTDGR